jgi:thymidylate synthase (FAD)
MDRFTVEVISQTPNPQQTMYAAMHQDYAEGFVAHDRDQWPNEERCGDILVTSLLKGGRGHYGPLEHPQIVFNVGWFPHSTMQQIRTHRVGVSFDVQCLAGDTEVTFVKASGMLRKVTIAELYDLWTNGEKAIRERKVKGRNGEAPGPYRRDCKRRLKAMSLRVLNEETGQFETSHLRDVMCSGLQPVYRMTFEDGRTLDCTTNHRLLTTEGWQTMGEAVGLETTPDGGVASITRHCSVLANGIVAAGKGLYRDKSWLVHQIELGRSAKGIADLAECSETAVRDWANRLGLRLNRSSTQFQKGHSPWNHDPDAAYHDKQWLDESLAYEFDNLVSLCKGCHEYIHHNHLEAEFAVGLQPITEPKNWQSKPKPEGRKLRAHALKVIRVEYLGLQMTYDLEVEDPWHNFVANGLVVHNSFRYTGQRILDVVDSKRDVEEVFYLRPLGFYTDRQGKKYEYNPDARQQDLDWCLEASRRYKTRIDQGFAEEHARGLIPFDIRQHWVMSANVRSVMHLLDLRWKADAQLEAQKMCEAIWPHFAAWVPAIAAWYEENRLKKARLAP